VEFTRVLENAADALGEALPGIGGAVLLLVVGLLVASIAGRLTRAALGRLGVDDLAERSGVSAALTRVGIDRSLSQVLGNVVRITLALVVVFAAVSLLGLAALSVSLNAVLLFLPKLLVALALVITGAIVAQLVGDRIDRVATQMAIAGPVGRVAQISIFAIFLVTALAQVGISTSVFVTVVAIVLTAGALMLALAFGLGGREMARQVTAGRYVTGVFSIGQTIGVDGIRGEIVALESAATVLRTDEGRTLRVPNHLLLESVVTLHDGSVANGL
jgi:Conserved TM helix/Mechanosensitive ion channel